MFEKLSAATFDAILMDIMMPVMDGLSATRAIRALEREDAGEIPIIAMTANAFEEDEKKSLEAGSTKDCKNHTGKKQIRMVKNGIIFDREED